jgi:hypothetical protein
LKICHLATPSRTPLKVKLHRVEKVLEILKWACFLTCCALCIWKIAESFVTYGEKEVGTKIELKSNHETDLPGFAVCRDRFLQSFISAQNVSDKFPSSSNFVEICTLNNG